MNNDILCPYCNRRLKEAWLDKLDIDPEDGCETACPHCGREIIVYVEGLDDYWVEAP